MTATAPAAAPAPGTEEIQRRRSRRRPHRRRRGLRHRRRAPPAGAVPRPDVRHPGRPGQPGRNLVDPPVPGRALRQRPVHLRLPVQAVARPAIAAGEEILAYLDEVIDEDDLGQYIRYRHRVTAASWSTEDRRWTVEVTRERHRTAAAVHRRLPVDVPGLLQPRQALPAPVGRHGPLPGRGRAPPAVARGPRPGGQARRRDRLRRHGRDADPRDSRARRST